LVPVKILKSAIIYSRLENLLISSNTKLKFINSKKATKFYEIILVF